jgi:hypothetical protein
MRRAVNLILLAAALLLLAEEWVWERLKDLTHRLSALPAVHAFEQRLRALPPWASLAVLATPALLLFPFKLAAMWALCHGHPALGVCVLVSAKLVGTATAAYLFDLVRDGARRLAWFDRLYVRVTGLLLRCHAWVQGQPAYVRMRGLMRVCSASLRAHFAGRPGLQRKMRAAKVVGRRWRCCLIVR